MRHIRLHFFPRFRRGKKKICLHIDVKSLSVRPFVLRSPDDLADPCRRQKSVPVNGLSALYIIFAHFVKYHYLFLYHSNVFCAYAQYRCKKSVNKSSFPCPYILQRKTFSPQPTQTAGICYIAIQYLNPPSRICLSGLRQIAPFIRLSEAAVCI